MFFKSGTSIKLAKESSNVLDIFTQTVDSLKRINEVAEQSISENERKKAEIEKELCSLSEIKTKNETVICKIEKIFV